MRNLPGIDRRSEIVVGAVNAASDVEVRLRCIDTGVEDRNVDVNCPGTVARQRAARLSIDSVNPSWESARWWTRARLLGGGVQVSIRSDEVDFRICPDCRDGAVR